MNAKQKNIIKWSVGIILLMLLFPPYTAYNGYTKAQEDLGFNFILTGAEIKYTDATYSGTIKLDQLLIQWLGVSIVGAGLIFAAKD